MSEKQLMIVTAQNNYYVDPLCELDEEGSIVRFYLDGQVQFACPREEFKWCELVTK